MSTCKWTKLSFRNKHAFYKCIDSFPHGTKWEFEHLEIEGDELDERGANQKEILDLWKCKPVECI